MRTVIIILIVFVSLLQVCAQQSLLDNVDYEKEYPDLLPIKKNSKWGLINREGKVILEPRYEFISGFDHNDLAVIVKERKEGLFGKDLNVKLEAKYEEVKFLHSHYYLLRKGNQAWIYNSTENKTEGPVLSAAEITYLNKNRFLLQTDSGKYGVIDNRGEISLNNIYDTVYYEDPYYFARLEKKYELFNKDLKHIFSGYTEEIVIDSLFVIVRNNGSYTVIGNNGDTLLNEFDDYILHTWYLEFIENDKRGIFNSVDLKMVCKAEYDDTYYVDGYYWGVTKGEKSGIINNKGITIIPLKYDQAIFADNYFYVKNAGKWGLCSKDGDQVHACKYDDIWFVDDNVLIVQNGKKRGLINTSGSILHMPVADKIVYLNNSAKIYSDSVVTVLSLNQNGGLEGKNQFNKVGFINVSESGIYRSNSANNSSVRIENRCGWFYSKEYKKWGLKDSTGKVVITPRYNNVKVYEDIGLTMVTRDLSPGKRSYFSIGRFQRSVKKKHGIVDHKKGRIIQPPVLWDIQIDDYNKGYGFVRCMRSNYNKISYYRLYDSTRNDGIDYSVNYIGDDSEEYIRVYRGGKYVPAKYQDREHVGNIYHDIFSKYFLHNTDAIKHSRNGSPYFKLEGGKWTYWNTNGQYMFRGEFDFAEDFKNGTAIVRKKDKWGVINSNSNVINISYDDLIRLPNSNDSLFRLAKRIKQFGLIDSTGNIKIECSYNDIYTASDKLFRIKQHNKWGYIDQEDEQIIAVNYDRAKSFSEGLAAVKGNRKWGYINEQGDTIVDFIFSNAGDFHDGLAWVKKKRKAGYINMNGEFVIAHPFTKCYDFVHGYAKVRVKSKYGIINKQGDWVVKPKFRDVSTVKEGIVYVKKKKYFVYCDTTGKRIIKKKFKKAGHFASGLAPVKKGSWWGYINKQGKTVIPYNYKQAKTFYNGVAIVSNGFHYGLIDTVGNVIVPLSYRRIYDFDSSGIAIVRLNNIEYNYINEKGELLLVHNVFGAIPFNNNVTAVKYDIDGLWCLINRDGEKLTDEKYTKIESLGNGYYKYKVAWHYGVADLSGEILVNIDKENIEFAGGGLFLIESGNAMGYWNANDDKWVWQSNKLDLYTDN